MTVYNMSWTDTTNTLPDAMVQANFLTDGLFGGLLLLTIFIIFLAIFSKQHEFSKVLIVDSTIVSILGVLFWGFGIFPLDYVGFPIIVLVVSIIYFIWSQ